MERGELWRASSSILSGRRRRRVAIGRVELRWLCAFLWICEQFGCGVGKQNFGLAVAGKPQGRGVREREREREPKKAVREVERKAQRWQGPMGRHGCY